MPLGFLQRLRNAPDRLSRGSSEELRGSSESSPRASFNLDDRSVASASHYQPNPSQKGPSISGSPSGFRFLVRLQTPDEAHPVDNAQFDGDDELHHSRSSGTLRAKKSLPFLQKARRSTSGFDGKQVTISRGTTSSPKKSKPVPFPTAVRHAFDAGDRPAPSDSSAGTTRLRTSSASNRTNVSFSSSQGSSVIGGARSPVHPNFKTISRASGEKSQNLFQHGIGLPVASPVSSPERASASHSRDCTFSPSSSLPDQQAVSSTHQLLKQSPGRFDPPIAATSAAELHQQADRDVRRIALHLSPPPVGLERASFEERVDLIKGLESCYAGDQRRKSGRLSLEPGQVIVKIETFMQALLVGMACRGETDQQSIESLNLPAAFDEARRHCGIPRQFSVFDLSAISDSARGLNSRNIQGAGSERSVQTAAVDVLTPSSFGAGARQSEDFNVQSSQCNGVTPQSPGGSPSTSRPTESSRVRTGSRPGPATRPGAGTRPNSGTRAGTAAGSFASPSSSISMLLLEGPLDSSTGQHYSGHSLTPAPRRKGGPRRPTTAPEKAAPGEATLTSRAMGRSTDTFEQRSIGVRRTTTSAEKSPPNPDLWHQDALSQLEPPIAFAKQDLQSTATPSSLSPKRAISKKSSALSMVREISNARDDMKRLGEANRTGDEGLPGPTAASPLRTAGPRSMTAEDEASETSTLSGSSPSASVSGAHSSACSSVASTPGAYLAAMKGGQNGLYNPREAHGLPSLTV